MNIKKHIFFISKLLVIIYSIGYIIFKIYSENQKGILLHNTTEFTSLNWLYLFIVILLIPLNWLLESIKFKLLIDNIQPLALRKSIIAVLSGITVSIFTPNRIGDFGGRVLFLENKNRVFGIFATILGGLSQQLTTLIIGGILFPIFISKSDIFQVYNINISIIFKLIVVIIISILFAYLNIAKIGIVLKKLSFFRKHNAFVLFLQKYTRTELLIFLILSFARYSIFTSQFILLLWLFGIDLTYTNAIIGISQIYFFMVVIPTFALGELGVRSSLAVWVLSAFTPLASGVIAATMLLWFLNLATPAILGSFFLYKVKY